MRRYLFLITLFLFLPFVFGQESALNIDPQTIQGYISKIEQNAHLEADKKKQLQEIYTQVLKQLEVAKEWEDKIQRFTEVIGNTSPLLKKLREEKIVDHLSDKTNQDLSLSSLEQKLSQIEKKEKTLSEEYQKLIKKGRYREERRIEVPQLVISTEQKLKELSLKLSLAGSSDFVDSSKTIFICLSSFSFVYWAMINLA